jgi:membrane protease YdiL (CAAX protease family)
MSKNKFPSKRLLVFFALTYGLSWLFWVPVALSGQDVTTTVWLIPYVLGGFGPSVAGIIMVYRSRDEEVRRDFWKRVVDFRRISVGWYLFVLTVFPVSISISILLNHLFGNPLPDLDMLKQVVANPLMLVAMAATGIITGPLSEELGWRGYALDRLQARWSPLVSSLILASFWWGWHLPLFSMRGTTQYAWGFATPSFWLFLIGTVPLSILLTWVYNHNKKSILAAVLFHFAHNFTLGLVHPFSTTVNLLQVILLFATAMGIVLADRSRLQMAAPRQGREAY